jgi:hypothetical protein
MCERRRQNNEASINPFTYQGKEHLVKPVNKDGRWKQRHDKHRHRNWHHNANKGYTLMLPPDVEQKRKNLQLAAARANKKKTKQRKWVPSCHCMPHHVSVNCRVNHILTLPVKSGEKVYRTGEALKAAGSVIPVKWSQGWVAGGRPQEYYRVHSSDSEQEPDQ